jgi:hypothetical protein
MRLSHHFGKTLRQVPVWIPSATMSSLATPHWDGIYSAMASKLLVKFALPSEL